MILAAINFLLGAFDAYITQRRIRDYGVNVELNGIIRALATYLGPYLAAIIGVLGPCVGWTYIFTALELPIPLAILIGFNLKRFEIQWSSLQFEAEVKALKNELNKRATSVSKELSTVTRDEGQAVDVSDKIPHQDSTVK